MTTDPTSPPDSFHPGAAVLAYLVPGLGYVAHGKPLRALYVFIGVMGVFLGGMLIGGIDVVDRKEDKWWFVLQAGVGPIAWGVDWVHQNQLKAQPPAQPRNTKSLGKVNEVGSLWCAMAGMLNAIAVIDCLWHAPRRRRSQDPLPAGAS